MNNTLSNRVIARNPVNTEDLGTELKEEWTTVSRDKMLQFH